MGIEIEYPLGYASSGPVYFVTGSGLYNEGKFKRRGRERRKREE